MTLRYKQLIKRLKCVLALRISSRRESGSVRATLRPFSRKLSIRHTLLRLEIRKELGLTRQEKYIRR